MIHALNMITAFVNYRLRTKSIHFHFNCINLIVPFILNVIYGNQKKIILNSLFPSFTFQFRLPMLLLIVSQRV